MHEIIMTLKLLQKYYKFPNKYPSINMLLKELYQYNEVRKKTKTKEIKE